jgi:hypothetical protein
MFASLISSLENPEFLLASVPGLIFTIFTLWMVVHAVRQRDWVWVVFMVVFPLCALWYFFQFYRSGDLSTRGFELPGADSRRRIKELKAQIHHLDKPHHHLQLGDIYFQRGKLDLAEAEYRTALERDSADPDIRSHLGQCLLRKNKPTEAQPLLEAVVQADSKHDYGYSLMALAETYTALGHADAARQVWERVLQQHSYARARVQLAELFFANNQFDAAREHVNEVIASDAHAPAFDRRRNRVWLARARKLRGKLPAA